MRRVGYEDLNDLCRGIGRSFAHLETRDAYGTEIDFYVFDDETVLFLHYAGDGTNTTLEITDDPGVVRACADAFEDVWKLATPALEYRPQ
jgi:hypothetical protein